MVDSQLKLSVQENLVKERYIINYVVQHNVLFRLGFAENKIKSDIYNTQRIISSRLQFISHTVSRPHRKHISSQGESVHGVPLLGRDGCFSKQIGREIKVRFGQVVVDVISLRLLLLLLNLFDAVLGQKALLFRVHVVTDDVITVSGRLALLR